jgi:hypothetical protein
MIAIGFIEFMMFICIPGVFVIMLISFVCADNSESSVRERQHRTGNLWGDDSEDDEQGYELRRDMSYYYRNENFDRQQGNR